MTFRQTPNFNSMNSINNNQKTPVALIKTTYDPSRQMSYMQNSIKKMPTNQLPPSPQSYPQPSKTISVSTPNSAFSSNANLTPLDNKIMSHPSESGRPPSGLPVHPNSKEGQNMRSMQNMQNMQNMQKKQDNSPQDLIVINKVSDKIYTHFKSKYPSTIEASGFNKSTIITIINKSIEKDPLNEKSISKIIDIIDHKFKTTINSDNRQGVQYDTTNFSMDTESKISIDKYLENYTNKVSILLDSDKAIEADLPKTMAPVNDIVKITPPEPFSEDFPIRDRKKQTDMMIPEVREYDYYVVINSNDRDIVRFPDPNTFVINFAPAPSGDAKQTGYIDRSFSNIKSCELINIVLLNTSNIAGSTDHSGIKYPYLLLQFDELQNSYYGTNANITKSFSILTDYTIIGNYRYYNIFGTLGDSSVTRVYNPRINLTKLTTKILLPDGSPFNFGTENINDTSNSCITFGFKITTIQKNLGTSFMNTA